MGVAKRPAASSQAAPRSKKQKLVVPPGLAKKCQGIGDTVMKDDSLPMEARKMLRASLKTLLATPQSQRDDIQAKLLAWTRGSVLSVEKTLKDQVAAEEEVAKRAGEEELTRALALEAAKAVLVAATELVVSKKGEMRVAQEASEASKSSLKTAQATQKSEDAALESAEQKKEKVEQTRSTFAKLTAGDDEESREADIKYIVKAAKGFSLEETMLDTLPKTLRKLKDQRGGFDDIVTSSFEKEIEKRYDDLNECIANGATAKAERAAAVEAAQAAIEACKTKEEECKAEVHTAQEAADTAECNVSECQSVLNSYHSDMKKGAADLSAKQKQLAQLEKGPVANLQDLEAFDGVLAKSQYKTIKGVHYERDLLDIADAAKGPLTQETAKQICSKAMDGNKVTPTEKLTIRFIIENYEHEAESKQFLMAELYDSWYQMINGILYDKSLLQLAADVEKPITSKSAMALWEGAQDNNGIDVTQLSTLEYIAKHIGFEDDAKALLAETIAGAKKIHA